MTEAHLPSPPHTQTDTEEPTHTTPTRASADPEVSVKESVADALDSDVAMVDDSSASEIGEDLDDGPIPEFEDETMDAKEFEADAMDDEDEAKGEGLLQRATRRLVGGRGGPRKEKRGNKDIDSGVGSGLGAGPGGPGQGQGQKVLDKDYKGKLDFDPFMEQLMAESNKAAPVAAAT
ncbi:hypothetical protein T439DRAFT_323889 [Meredithblackwellia eburnea MCA 4105]